MLWKRKLGSTRRRLVWVVMVCFIAGTCWCPVARADLDTDDSSFVFESNWGPFLLAVGVGVLTTILILHATGGDELAKGAEEPGNDATVGQTLPMETLRVPQEVTEVEATSDDAIEILLNQRLPCRIRYVAERAPARSDRYPSSGYVRPRTRTTFGRIIGFGADSLSVRTCPQTIWIQRQSINSLERLDLLAAKERKKRKFAGAITLGMGVGSIAFAAGRTYQHPIMESAEQRGDALFYVLGTTLVIGGLVYLMGTGKAERELDRLTAIGCE